MEYKTWIPLAHNIFVSILSFITLCSSINVFFYKFLWKRNIKLLPILRILFFYHFLWSLTSFINTVYLLAFWRPIESAYNERLIYLLGVLPDTLLFLNSIMGIFLCCDRCLTIIFPFKYDKRCRKYLGYGNGVALILIYGITLWLNKSFANIPSDRATTCYYRGCIVGSTTAPYFTTQKIAFSIVDICFGMLLFILLRCNFHSQNSNFSKTLNVKALLIVISSTIFDFCPSLFFRFISLNLEKPLSWYIGPYLITLGSLGVTLSARIYAKAFKNAKNSSVQFLS